MNSNRAIINFIGAAIFGTPTDSTCRPEELHSVFTTAKRNAIASIVYKGIGKSALQLPEKLDEAFREEWDKSLYMFTMQMQQLAEISLLFEKAEIPFVILKGSRMREFYPSPELRTSCDIDILVRADDEKLVELMQGAGLSFERDGGTTLNFRRGIAVEVELHRYLFDDELSFSGYFSSVWERVKLMDGWKYQYLMTEEDFYVNMIAHFAKHFTRYGSGIRNVLDIAVYLKNAPADFDLEKAEQILKDIGLYEFEQKILQLTRVWETGAESEDDELLTDYILGCGVFGNTLSRSTHAVTTSEEKSKSKMLWQHIFPNWNIMCNLYPVLRKCPILLPFCWIARSFRLIFCDRHRIQTVLKQQASINEESLSATERVLKQMHLETVLDGAKKTEKNSKQQRRNA